MAEIKHPMLAKARAYIKRRRLLGYQLSDAGMIVDFASFMDRVDPHGPLTVSRALEWVGASKQRKRNTQAGLLSAIRGFARYCASLDARTQVPPPGLLGPQYSRRRPHIFTQAQIRLILSRARALSPRTSALFALTYETLMGLLACTGMRSGEARRLKPCDFDADTRAGYRNTFRLLLGFLSKRHHCPIDQLTLPLLDPESVLAFLDYLEGERGNCAHTRNLRLAAIRAFVRFALGAGCVEYIETAHRILAVPAKRTARSTPAFMTREEVNAVLRAIDTHTRSGRRDLLLFTLLYNTGARIGEALQLRARDVRERVVHLHGKGRKDRDVPLWPQTARLMKRWCVENHVGADQLVFTNRWGEPLSHDGASHRLDLAVKKAARKLPSLNEKRITAHRFRNSCAMALLQAGVPLEIIALYLGHSRPITTHGYIEADLKMKADTLRQLDEPHLPKRHQSNEQSRLLSFLEAVV